MMVEPCAKPFAEPTALIAATVVFEELQATVVLRSCMVPSEKVPIAVNACAAPAAMDAVAGVTARLCRVAAVI
jgi:hypothetical protein